MTHPDNLDMFGEKRILVANQAAYAGKPGSGPAGKTCKDCAVFTLTGTGKTKYRKCGLVNWTNGRATDIKAKTPACNKYKQSRAEYYGINAAKVTAAALRHVTTMRKRAGLAAEAYAEIDEGMSVALDRLLDALTDFETAVHASAAYLADAFDE